jgi:hypothetical protein
LLLLAAQIEEYNHNHNHEQYNGNYDCCSILADERLLFSGHFDIIIFQHLVFCISICVSACVSACASACMSACVSACASTRPLRRQIGISDLRHHRVPSGSLVSSKSLGHSVI